MSDIDWATYRPKKSVPAAPEKLADGSIDWAAYRPEQKPTSDRKADQKSVPNPRSKGENAIRSVITGAEREMMAAEQRVVPGRVEKQQPLGEVLVTDAGDNRFYKDASGNWQEIDLKKHVILPDNSGRRIVYPANESDETNLLDSAGRIAREALVTTPPGSLLKAVGKGGQIVKPAALERTEQAAEFDIPLSRGQATQKFKQQAFEQSAVHGAKGETAGNILRGFGERQGKSVEASRAEVGSFGAADSADAITAAENVMTKARTLATTKRAEIKAMYQTALSQRASINSENLKSLPSDIAAYMDQAGIFVDDLTPAAKAAVKDIEDLAAFKPDRMASARPAMAEGEGPANIVAVSLEAIDRTRRKISARIGSASTQTDRAAAVEIKRAYDKWIDSAVDNALFEGSEDALSALKDARKARREYAQMFQPQAKGDDAGRIIEAIVTRGEGTDGAKTPLEIANYMFGASQVGKTGTSVRLAQRLEKVLGKSSDEFRAVKQGLWDRLTTRAGGTTQLGAEALSNRIIEFLDGPSRQLSTQVFTLDERAKMRRFAEAVKLTVPIKAATNPPKSGYTVARDVWSQLSNIMSFGGVAAGVSGEPAGLAIAGASILSKLKAPIQAARATKGIQPARVLTGRSVPVVGASGRSQNDE